MFDNPGKSLKKLGGAIWGIGGILSLIGGMWMFVLAQQASQSYYSDSAGGFVFGGVIIITVGIFVSWLISVFIVAFGELVENSTAIRKNLSDLPTHQ